MVVVFLRLWIMTVTWSRVLGPHYSSCCWMQSLSIQFILFLSRFENVKWHMFFNSVDVGSVFVIQPDQLLYLFLSMIRCQWPKYWSPLKNGKKYVPFGLWRTLGDPHRFDIPDHVVLYSLQYVVALLLAIYNSWG